MFRHAYLTCVLGLTAMALHAQTIPVNSVRTTPMLGIAEGQTARLNLLNPGVQPPALGAICSAAIAFIDANGDVVKTASVAVPPGKSLSVDLHGDADLSLAVGVRREIRATITIPAILPPSTSSGSGAATGSTGSSSSAVPSCKLVPTLEMFDSLTGRTQAVVGHTVSID